MAMSDTMTNPIPDVIPRPRRQWRKPGAKQSFPDWPTDCTAAAASRLIRYYSGQARFSAEG